MIYIAAGSDEEGGGGGGGSGTVTQINTSGSVTGGSITTTGTISLVNDNATPGPNRFYGTDLTGTKGFFPVPSPTLQSTQVAFGDASNTITSDPDFFYDITGGQAKMSFGDNGILVTSSGSNGSVVLSSTGTSGKIEHFQGSGGAGEFTRIGDCTNVFGNNGYFQINPQLPDTSGFTYFFSGRGITIGPVGYVFPSTSPNDGDVLTKVPGPSNSLAWLPSGGGASLPLTEVGFGTGTGITSTPNFTYDSTLNGGSFRFESSSAPDNTLYFQQADGAYFTSDNFNNRARVESSGANGARLSYTFDRIGANVTNGFLATSNNLFMFAHDGSNTTTWTMPTSDGLAGYAIVTDGAGTLSFAPVSSVFSVVNTNSVFSTAAGVVAGSSSAATQSFFALDGAGDNATNASDSIFIGAISGTGATNASSSVFLGNGAGNGAENADHSFFAGQDAGGAATGASNSIFIGQEAGNGASSASSSVFLGLSAGFQAQNANDSIFIGNSSGNSATEANNSIFMGTGSGTNSTNANSSIFLGQNAGQNAPDAQGSIFIGDQAGISATNSAFSVFIGFTAGQNADNVTNGVFLGQGTGAEADNANDSFFALNNAGNAATNAGNSIFIGVDSGLSASDAANSIFLGQQSGRTAANANDSIFIGSNAGNNAQLAANSIFIGSNAGANDSVDNFSNDFTSILIGRNTTTNAFVASVAIGDGAGNSENYQFLVESQSQPFKEIRFNTADDEGYFVRRSGVVDENIQFFDYGTTNTLVLGSYNVQVGENGTGAATIILPTSDAKIGQTYIIKDYGLDASNQTIVIDADTGNFIRGTSPGVSQTFTMDTDGQSVMIVKVNSNTWSIM